MSNSILPVGHKNCPLISVIAKYPVPTKTFWIPHSSHDSQTASTLLSYHTHHGFTPFLLRKQSCADHWGLVGYRGGTSLAAFATGRPPNVDGAEKGSARRARSTHH